MILEEVLPHPYRDDLYLNTVVTPFDKIEFKIKEIVNQILLIEVNKIRYEVATAF